MFQPRSFGQWVRQRRKALDLTQAALARQAYCSLSAIEKIEANRRRPARSLAERLADILGIDPADRNDFLRAARAIEAAASAAPPRNLPIPPTTFIGREREGAALRALLRQDAVRLLTLTGTGGVGKTRLALHVAADLADEFVQGVFFVPLATVRTPERVAPAIAQAIEVPESGARSIVEGLKQALSDRSVLLLLDNFEYVVDAAPLLTELLAAAPQLKLLVTSRAPLRLEDEHEFVVPPLDLPNLARLPSMPVLAQNAAVALFAARAQTTGDYILTRENAPTIAEVCVRLDGLPLSIELAAARSRLFTLETLLARLSHRLALLTGGARDQHPRQQTLRATISWSYDLLSSEEQTLFARLSVFAGGCRLDAVEQVCACAGAGAIHVLDGLSALLEHNLVQQANGGQEPRFTMLETLREFALERLVASGEADILLAQHACYYLALAERAAPELTQTGQDIWRARLLEEQENIRAGLQWASEQGTPEEALRFGAALWRYWKTSGQLREGQQWLEAACTMPGTAPDSIRAVALVGAGSLATDLGQIEYAYERLALSEQLFQAVGDTSGRALALNALGAAASYQNDYARAQQYFAAAEVLFRELGDVNGLAITTNNLGVIAQYYGDYARARELFAEGLSWERQQGNRSGIADSLMNLGYMMICQGEPAGALPFYEESLSMYQDLESMPGMANVLISMGMVALQRAAYSEAMHNFTQALDLFETLKNKLGQIRVRIFLAEVHVEQGDYEGAARYCKESLLLRQELGGNPGGTIKVLAYLATVQGNPLRAARLYAVLKTCETVAGVTPLPFDRAKVERYLAAARAQVDPAAWEAAYAAGQAMSMEGAIAFALDS